MRKSAKQDLVSLVLLVFSTGIDKCQSDAVQGLKLRACESSGDIYDILNSIAYYQ